MKKLFASIVSLAMTAGLSLSVAACGGDKVPKGEKLSPDASWEKILEERVFFDNCKIEGTVKGTNISPQETVNTTGEYVAIYANKMDHTILKSNGGEWPERGEYFYEEEDSNDDGYSTYMKDENGKWVPFEYDTVVSVGVLVEKFSIYKDSEKRFTFDEKDGAYVYDEKKENPYGENDGEIHDICRLKFKNGKLFHVFIYSKSLRVIDGQNYGGEYTWDYTITYGGQSLTLPEASVA